jgi:hypothetical protein
MVRIEPHDLDLGLAGPRRRSFHQEAVKMSIVPESAPFQTLLLLFGKPDSKPRKHRP